MPASDPLQSQPLPEAIQHKQIYDDSAAFRRALNDLLVESVRAHSALMQIIMNQAASNADLRDKMAAKWLEVGPIEAASTSSALQMAIKAAQTTPPPTAGGG